MKTRSRLPKRHRFIVLIATLSISISACAPRVVQMSPLEGRPGTIVSVTMEYLVGWPRVEIGNRMMGLA